MGGFTKNQYRGERFPKKEFADLGGGRLARNGGGVQPPFPCTLFVALLLWLNV